MANITTSIVVNFDSGADEDAILSMEVDSREDGLNSGKTQFRPGDSVNLLLFKSSNVVVDSVITSLGSIANTGTGQFAVEDEFIQFINEPEVTVNKPISSGFTSQWVGKNLGNFTRTESVITLANPPAEPYVGVNRIGYQSNYTSYRLSSTNFALPTYSIVIYVTGRTV